MTKKTRRSFFGGVQRAGRGATVAEVIEEVVDGSRRRYGAPRIHAERLHRGHRISKKTVAKIMKENGIFPPWRKRCVPITMDSRDSHRIAPNLLEQNFEVSEPNTVWLADISCIPTNDC